MIRRFLHTISVFAVLFLFCLSCSQTDTNDNSSDNNITDDDTVITDPVPEPSPHGPLPEAPLVEPDPIAQHVSCEPDTFCIITTELSNAHVGEVYSETITVQGGTGVGYTWSIGTGELPDGIDIEGHNDVLFWGDFILSGDVDYGADNLAENDLTEISGLAVSRLNPGVLWVIDDSGGREDLFAIDESGNVLQKYTISGVSNHDWEDMAIGKGPDPSKEYLYIGDFGDNYADGRRPNYQIVRVQEPSVSLDRQDTISITGDTFYFTYPDGFKNCETMLMDWEDEIIYLIEKIAGVGKVYKFPSPMNDLWNEVDPVTLTEISNSGIVSGLITGGSTSRDNERILIRQYGRVYEYVRPYGADFEDIFDQEGHEVSIGEANNPQYETIAYSADGKVFYTITEQGAVETANIPIYKFEADLSPNTSAILGTPTLAGTYSFIIKVKDSAGYITSREFSIKVE